MSNDKKKQDETNTTVPAPVQHERRSILGTGGAGAAAALLGLVVAACGDDTSNPSTTQDPSTSSSSSGKASSSSGGDGGNGGGGGMGGGGGGGPKADNDIEPLNGLLTAEYLAITAYSAGAGLIGSADASDPLKPLADVITDVAVAIQAQHKLHAVALADAITDLGGKPVKEADVAPMFMPPAALVSNPTISNVLKFAAGAERSAAVAYNATIAQLEAAKYRFLATAIEGDETQHFIVLAALVLGLADPGPNLSATTAADVVPDAFVFTVGAEGGLDAAPPDYFA